MSCIEALRTRFPCSKRWRLIKAGGARKSCHTLCRVRPPAKSGSQSRNPITHIVPLSRLLHGVLLVGLACMPPLPTISSAVAVGNPKRRQNVLSPHPSACTSVRRRVLSARHPAATATAMESAFTLNILRRAATIQRSRAGSRNSRADRAACIGRFTCRRNPVPVEEVESAGRRPCR